MATFGLKLDGPFCGKKRNFITHIGPKTFGEPDVPEQDTRSADPRGLAKVNGKLDPTNTEIKFPHT